MRRWRLTVIFLTILVLLSGCGFHNTPFEETPGETIGETGSTGDAPDRQGNTVVDPNNIPPTSTT